MCKRNYGSEKEAEISGAKQNRVKPCAAEWGHSGGEGSSAIEGAGGRYLMLLPGEGPHRPIATAARVGRNNLGHSVTIDNPSTKRTC